MPNWKKLVVSGSDASLASLNISGNLTASAAYLESASIGHLETIYETASVIYSSGSTKFGDTSDDTHERTGSLFVSGNISIVEGGSLIGTASIADFATTSSYISTASFADSATTASQADNATSSSIADELSGLATASFSITASHALNVPSTASHALTAVTSSHTAGTASISNTATTSSYTLTGDGTFSGSFSGSFQGDASDLNVNPFPFTGSGEMQGQLIIESFQDYVDENYVEGYFAGTAISSNGDIALTGSIFSPYINANSFTGSLSGSFIGSGIIDSASLAETASFVETAQTASYYGGSVTSASLAETASFYGGSVTSASLAETASFVETAQTASFVETAQTASFVETAQTASYALVASQSVNNNTSSGSLSFWQGSQAEYDLISASADQNTVYFVA